jgi:hypothetical protein
MMQAVSASGFGVHDTGRRHIPQVTNGCFAIITRAHIYIYIYIYTVFSTINTKTEPKCIERPIPYRAVNTLPVSVIKTSQLLLYREIVVICSEIHTKHINILCGQNVELLNV